MDLKKIIIKKGDKKLEILININSNLTLRTELKKFREGLISLTFICIPDLTQNWSA